MPLIVIFAGTAVILLLLVIFKDHEIRNIKKQLRVLSNSDGNGLIHSTYGFRTQNEFINSINDLLKELRSIRVEYSAKSHDLEQMMTNISHDLRTPLTSAMGYVDIIIGSDLPPEEKERELAIVRQRLTRLKELIDSFFEFSQIISRDKPPELVSVDLVGILQEAIVHYYDDFSDQGRMIRFNCAMMKLELCSNRNLLMRIFDNLISNARKHGTGGLDVNVTVDKNICRISFENQVVEVMPDMERIFDEFYTTDISRTKGDTGLGLAIAKQFTVMLGGRISAAGEGEKFAVTVEFDI